MLSGKLLPLPLFKPLDKFSKFKPSQLEHGLEKVLATSGPVFLKDSNGYNFDPYLENIPKIEDFDMTKIRTFVPAIRDNTLWLNAKENKSKFIASTSSISGFISQFYKLIADRGRINQDIYTNHLLQNVNTKFSPFLTSGAKINLIHNDGMYGIEAPSNTSFNYLMNLGHVMELFLTKSPSEFAQYLKKSKAKIENQPLAYHYAEFGNFLLRSQLDAYHDSLPKKTFDLKARASLPVRRDIHRFESHGWYEIVRKLGAVESFEREHFDMARTAFIKYSLQVRIGNMDGVFVAYHNTFKNFGFEYISLEDMENAMFGDSLDCDQLFSLSMQLANAVLESVTELFPNQNTEIFVTRPISNNLSVLITSEGKNPRVLVVKARNAVDGKFHQSPIVSGKEKWELDYSIEEIPYNAKLQVALQTYNKLTNGSGSIASDRYMTDLKGLVDEMRLLEERELMDQ